MKSFVRDKHDEILIGLAVLIASVFMLAAKLVSELFCLPLILAGVILCVSELRRWRRERAKERSGAARSTGSR